MRGRVFLFTPYPMARRKIHADAPGRVAAPRAEIPREVHPVKPVRDGRGVVELFLRHLPMTPPVSTGTSFTDEYHKFVQRGLIRNPIQRHARVWSDRNLTRKLHPPGLLVCEPRSSFFQLNVCGVNFPAKRLKGPVRLLEKNLRRSELNLSCRRRHRASALPFPRTPSTPAPPR